MTAPSIHVSLITLGVNNLDAAATFYEGMGLKRAGFESDSVVFFDMGGLALGLFPRAELAKDAAMSEEGSGFRGISLAWNLASAEAVDEAVERAVKLGAQLTKKPELVFWGGYSGYITDLDGHLWEIAFNPAWPLRENGAMELPPPAKS